MKPGEVGVMTKSESFPTIFQWERQNLLRCLHLKLETSGGGGPLWRVGRIPEQLFFAKSGQLPLLHVTLKASAERAEVLSKSGDYRWWYVHVYHLKAKSFTSRVKWNARWTRVTTFMVPVTLGSTFTGPLVPQHLWVTWNIALCVCGSKNTKLVLGHHC